MKHEIITIMAVLMCGLSIYPSPAQAKYGGGSGEPDNPYLIYTSEHMNAIGADYNDWDKCFKLMADIDLSWFTGTSFNTIENFTGVFDGNGNTISNFTYTSTNINYRGLFGFVTGDIKDLGLIAPDVDTGIESLAVGTLVGELRNGTVVGCYSTGASVSGGTAVGGLVGQSWWGTITNCYAIGHVSGKNFVGGLVGLNHPNPITNCYSFGSVSSRSCVGGLVGINFSGIITNCYSSASVSGDETVGGLVGDNYMDGIITNCYSTGSVTGNYRVGGLVGSSSISGYAIASFWDIQTSGQTTSDGGTGLTTAEMQTASTFIAWGCEPVWTIGEGVDYPRLVWENKPGELITVPSDLYGGGAGEPNDPYLIYTAEQLNTIGLVPCHLDKHFRLMADIDLSAFTGTTFNIMGTFTGVFDGNGHKISNFSNSRGLFGYVSGEIKDLGLIDPNIDAGTGGTVGSLVDRVSGGTIIGCYVEGGNISGNSSVGGLVGDNSGTITNCYSTGSVTGTTNVGGLVGFNGCYAGCIARITNCYSTGSVNGDGYVGGLVGNNSGTISNCYSTGSTSGSGTERWEGRVGGLVGYNGGIISNCTSSASVSGYDYVGGLVGRNSYGTITNCYSTANVLGARRVGGLVGWNYGGTITSCTSSASVSGTDLLVGGLVGHNWLGSITNCYSTCSVSGYDYVGGLVGRNTYGTITNCYSTGGVTGIGNVGGLVGSNAGELFASFWDIVTSGQDWSHGGTGLPTAEMQMASTFTDAGWDFVGETFNGIEDIWFIQQGDYPHLWWEGMQVPMKLTPRTLNCRSEGNWVKAHIQLPQGFTVEDVDSNRPAVLHSFGIESDPLYVFVNKDKVVEIEAAFEREAVCSLAGDWPQMLTVAGFLADGSIFLGTSTVKIIHPGMKVIEELANCWLQGDCVHPDFCDGIDMNRDSLVNLLDYALLMNTKVEFVTDE